eukprot:358477-Chlamydomonas_euryale.AAC.1
MDDLKLAESTLALGPPTSHHARATRGCGSAGDGGDVGGSAVAAAAAAWSPNSLDTRYGRQDWP